MRYPSRSSNREPIVLTTGTKSSAPERMKPSDSLWSRYCGSPRSVRRVMPAYPTLQPKPYGPFPEPESYERASAGVNPDRPGLSGRGIESEPVPVTGFAANFSPIALMAPPPLGSETAGGEKCWFFESSVFVGSWECIVPTAAPANQYWESLNAPGCTRSWLQLSLADL